MYQKIEGEHWRHVWLSAIFMVAISGLWMS